MTGSPPTPLHRISSVLYLAGILVIFDQLAILGTSILPLASGTVEWRYGAVGLAAGRLTPLLLGDCLLLVAAVTANHRGAMRVLAVLHLVLALAIAAAVLAFALDAIQVRRMLPLASQRGAMIAAIRAGGALALVIPLTAWISVRLFQLARHSAWAARDAEGSPLVVAGESRGR